MSGEQHTARSQDAASVLREAVELLSDRPCYALHRDPARNTRGLAAAIERFLDDLRVRHGVVLSLPPDLTSRTYLAYRDDEQSSEAIASLLGLSIADVERRLEDAMFAFTGISGVVAGRHHAG